VIRAGRIVDQDPGPRAFPGSQRRPLG
jgi:hypothetical protein